MTKLMRRTVELAVAFFALYAFIYVPLGENTAFEHLKAILATPEAHRAGDELKQAGSRMLGELLAFDSGTYRGAPVLPEFEQTAAAQPSP